MITNVLPPFLWFTVYLCVKLKHNCTVLTIVYVPVLQTCMFICICGLGKFSTLQMSLLLLLLLFINYPPTVFTHAHTVQNILTNQ